MQIKITIYTLAKFLGLFALCRLMTRSHIRILGYHGASLGDECNYNPVLFISPETFKRRIDWLRNKHFNVISLDLAVNGLVDKVDLGRLPTVITFDDGWHSTSKRLMPPLIEVGFPFTLYLHTGHFEADWPVPAVVVNYMIWKTDRQTIHLHGMGEEVDGDYTLAQLSDRELFSRRCCQWLVSPHTTRSGVIERIHHIADSLGLSTDDLALETRRFDYMSRDDLLHVAELGCAIELHGHNHRYPTGDPEAFASDLAACRDVILKLGLPSPRHYCYPSGSFDEGAAETLKLANVRSATTCVPGLVSLVEKRLGRYYLPRFLDAEHINMLTFEAELSGFAGLIRYVFGR